MNESEAIKRLKRGDITGLAPLVEAHTVLCHDFTPLSVRGLNNLPS